MGDTIGRPGGDAAVVRVHGTQKALAITTDCTPRYVKADPRMGGRQAVAETWRNLTAVGATPLAITDCMNFGNPQRPEIMGQLVGAIEGISEACLALDYPVVSGNVSLYNETNGIGIFPTPAIGGLGLLADSNRRADIAIKRSGDRLILIGETKGHLGASLYLAEIHGREEGAPPPVDLEQERLVGDFVRGLIQDGLTDTVHDLSDGGLAIGLCEMALAGHIGITVDIAALAIPAQAALFGEDQARYLVAVEAQRAETILKSAQDAGIAVYDLGTTGGETVTINGLVSLALTDLRTAHEDWMPGLMA